MGNRVRTLRLLPVAALVLALTAGTLMLAACGGKPKESTKSGSGSSTRSKPKVRASADGLAQYLEAQKESFAADVGGLDTKIGIGEMIRRNGLGLPAARLGLRRAAETAWADIVCVLSADGKHTLLRMSNPAAPTTPPEQVSSPEFWAIQGQCAAGPCVDMRRLIQRALDNGEPVTSFEAYPPELLEQERVLTFRAKDLDRVLQPPTSLEGSSLAEACKVTIQKPKANTPTEEPRALVISDVRPVRDADGKRVWGVLVSAWVLSRSKVILDAHKQKSRTDASFFLFQTRVGSTLVQPDGTSAIGQRISADVYRQIESGDELYQRNADLPYGRMDLCFRRLRDGTGNMIGALLAEAPTRQAGEELEELAAPEAAPEGAAEGASKAPEGHGAAKESAGKAAEKGSH